MILEVKKETITLDELKKIDRKDPYNVIGALIQTLGEYNTSKPNLFYDKLQYLVGDMQPLTEIMKQNIKDRMMQNEKNVFIGKSYFMGSTPENDYTPEKPLKIEIIENEYSKVEDGLLKLFIKSGGADSLRGVMVRLAKDGNYYVWSDSFMGLLADIRQPESSNPWA